MFKDTFSFDGRITRTEYGLSLIIYLAGFCFLCVQFMHHHGSNITMLGLIPLCWFHLAQGAKRCHDVGNSGWWQIIPLYRLWLLFEDGKAWPNQYGESPKYGHLQDEDYRNKAPFDNKEPQ
jgi:uncharacterized membrane protein YhaH (DUF805 family)